MFAMWTVCPSPEILFNLQAILSERFLQCRNARRVHSDLCHGHAACLDNPDYDGKELFLH